MGEEERTVETVGKTKERRERGERGIHYHSVLSTYHRHTHAYTHLSAVTNPAGINLPEL